MSDIEYSVITSDVIKSFDCIHVSAPDHFDYHQYWLELVKMKPWERSGSVVECFNRDRGVASFSFTGITALCL